MSRLMDKGANRRLIAPVPGEDPGDWAYIELPVRRHEALRIAVDRAGEVRVQIDGKWEKAEQDERKTVTGVVTEMLVAIKMKNPL